MDPVFSAHDLVEFTPPGSSARYMIAPLTFRQRAAMRADLARYGGVYPTNWQMFEALRGAVRQSGAANLPELVAAIDAAEAAPADQDAQRALQAIEAVCATAPGYGDLLAARNQYMGMLPFVAAKHALRGWEGEGLPEFRQERGVVPDALMDQLGDDLTAVGWRAHELAHVGKSAEGNSVSPSHSSVTPTPAKAARSRKTAASGS
jgi:hypothetical protein